MSAEFWDNIYSQDEYVYGTEPNEFFKVHLALLKPGKLILAGAGEGRNAVYAAKQGWQVTAFDQSRTARDKALALAAREGVEIDYKLASFEEIDIPRGEYDAVGMVFVHFPKEVRAAYHSKLGEALREGGSLIMELFEKSQHKYNSGGPNDIEQLYTEDIIRNDFRHFRDLTIGTAELELHEGARHQGKAAVLNVFGVR